MPEPLPNPSRENDTRRVINYQNMLSEAQRDPAGSEAKPYTPDEIARLSFDSFRFSQGGFGLQEDIIAYLVAKHPQRYTADAVAKSLAATERKAAAFIGAETAHDQKESRNPDLIEEMQRIAKLWEKALSRKGADTSSALPDLTNAITEFTLAYDYYYIVDRNGRPRANDSDEGVSKPNSKYLSHFVYYGLMGHNPHSEPFAEMFQDIVTNATINPERMIAVMSDDESSQFSQMPLREVLQTVASVHLQHYPADAAALEPEWRHQLSDDA